MTRPTTSTAIGLVAAALGAATLAPAAHAAARPATTVTAATGGGAAARAATAPGPMVGLTTIDLQGAASAALKKQHVTFAGGAPTTVTAAGRILLPVGSGSVARNTQLLQTGTLTLRRKVAGKSRAVVIRSLRLDLDGTPALSAVIGGRRVEFLALDLRRDEYTANAATSGVQILTARASLSTAAAKVIGTKLAIRALRPGLLGVLGTAAGVVIPAATPGGATAAPATTTTGPAAPTAATTVPGAAASVTPLARPATAQAIASDTLTWHVRESLIRYLNQGAPIDASGGASLGAPTSIAGAPPLIYDGIFVPAGGWADVATGTASLQFTGTIHLSYPAHGIDITVANPQVELSGAESRVLATYGGSSATAYTGIGVLATIAQAGAARSDSGLTSTYTATPAAVPSAAASSVFAGFYSPGDPFGNFTFSFTRAS